MTAEPTGGAVTCPTCGTEADPSARFCETCGTPLTPPTPPPGDHERSSGDHERSSGDHERSTAACACGGTFVDGWCDTCGSAQPRPRDHVVEHPAPGVAGVCDRGIRHRSNEDAMALGVVGPRVVLVVCDGVSSAPHSDVASLAAAQAARDVLLAAGPDAAAALQAAAVAANAAVVATTEDVSVESPPSCTFVASVVDGPTATAASVGDSRAYWFPDDAPAQRLTVDDSLAAQAISAGVPPEEAERMRGAHTITRWLGVDAPPVETTPTAVVVDRAGWLLVCSDGLWNYCSPAEALAGLVREHVAAAGDDVVAACEGLVRWANAQGGADNITVALHRVGGTPAGHGEQTGRHVTTGDGVTVPVEEGS